MRSHYFICLLYTLLCTLFSVAQQGTFLLKQIGAADGLESNVPLSNYEDSRGITWIGTYDGLYKYDGHHASRLELRYCDTCPGLLTQEASILESPKGKYWVITDKGLGIFNPFTGIFKPVHAQENVIWCFSIKSINDSILELNRCGDNSLFIHTVNEQVIPQSKVPVADYREAHPLWEYYGLFPPELIIPPNVKADFDHRNLKNSFLRQWVADSSGNVWLNTGKGIFLLPAKGDKVVPLADLFPQFTGDDMASTLRLDSRQMLWFAVRGKGVFLIDTRGNPFSHLRGGKESGSLQSDFVIGIHPIGKNKLAAFHDFGFSREASVIDATTNKVTAFERVDVLKRAVVDVRHKAIKGKPFHEADYPDSLRQYIYFWDDFFYSRFANFFYTKRGGYDLAEWPSGKRIKQGVSIISHYYQQDTVWLATENQGLAALYLHNGHWRNWYLDESGNNQKKSSIRVHGIVEDEKGNFWLGTSNGLAYFDKNTERFTTYTTRDGLCHNTIYCLTGDKRGRLWLGTGNGLSCFDPALKQFINYFQPDGVINTEYNRNSAYLSPDGRVYMGGVNGIDCFDPEQLLIKDDEAAPYIAQLKQGSQLLDPDEYYRFRHRNNFLSITLGQTNVMHARNRPYIYLLEGDNNGWKSLAGDNELNLVALSPGDYTLRIKILNRSGLPGEKEAVFHFSIAPAWFQTIWFKSLLVLGIIALTSTLIYYLQRQTIRKLEHDNEIMRIKAEQEALLARERERITADLHDDAGATLSSLYIYGDIANRLWEQRPEESRAMLSKIMHGSRDLIERMNDIIWSLKKPSELKNSLKLRLMNDCQELMNASEIKVDYNMDEILDKAITNPLVRKNLLLIAKEALNNIAKYSGAKEAWVLLNREEDALVLAIKDNGKGFEMETIKRGNGLGNMRMRSEQMGGAFTLWSEPGAGTEIRCLLPIPNISYS